MHHLSFAAPALTPKRFVNTSAQRLHFQALRILDNTTDAAQIEAYQTRANEEPGVIFLSEGVQKELGVNGYLAQADGLHLGVVEKMQSALKVFFNASGPKAGMVRQKESLYTHMRKQAAASELQGLTSLIFSSYFQMVARLLAKYAQNPTTEAAEQNKVLALIQDDRALTAIRQSRAPAQLAKEILSGFFSVNQPTSILRLLYDLGANGAELNALCRTGALIQAGMEQYVPGVMDENTVYQNGQLFELPAAFDELVRLNKHNGLPVLATVALNTLAAPVAMPKAVPPIEKVGSYLDWQTAEKVRLLLHEDEHKQDGEVVLRRVAALSAEVDAGWKRSVLSFLSRQWGGTIAPAKIEEQVILKALGFQVSPPGVKAAGGQQAESRAKKRLKLLTEAALLANSGSRYWITEKGLQALKTAQVEEAFGLTPAHYTVYFESEIALIEQNLARDEAHFQQLCSVREQEAKRLSEIQAALDSIQTRCTFYAKVLETPSMAIYHPIVQANLLSQERILAEKRQWVAYKNDQLQRVLGMTRTIESQLGARRTADRGRLDQLRRAKVELALLEENTQWGELLSRFNPNDDKAQLRDQAMKRLLQVVREAKVVSDVKLDMAVAQLPAGLSQEAQRVLDEVQLEASRDTDLVAQLAQSATEDAAQVSDDTHSYGDAMAEMANSCLTPANSKTAATSQRRKPV